MTDLPLSLNDYETIAKQRLSPIAWEYYASGSGDEHTVRWNREALANIRLKPRVLIDLGNFDTRLKLLGEELPHPILLAPTSTHMLAHPDGEVATVRGAGAAGATLIVSTVSNRSIEEVAQAATRPIWFQLYVEDDRGRTKALIERAEAAGCRALCITVDNPWHYARNRQDRIFDTAPKFPFPNIHLVSGGPGGRGREGGGAKRFTWKDLEWVQSFAKTPIALKGILNPEDADSAAKAGVAAIIVSNHGGRGLDTVPATIEALPVVAEKVSGRIPILMDGGIRRGGDVLKAIANGASGVLIGRPYLYGLGVAGAEGVRNVVDILRTEFEAAMALTGRTSIAAIDRSVLWPRKPVNGE
ncbi:MAG TPA: alpha-hydroxy acid oxidase [Verrucomicrobiae bacterium]|nr:alpha-hydroxy acid oxidase [Verrucomicrobiae bacterium]